MQGVYVLVAGYHIPFRHLEFMHSSLVRGKFVIIIPCMLIGRPCKSCYAHHSEAISIGDFVPSESTTLLSLRRSRILIGGDALLPIITCLLSQSGGFIDLAVGHWRTDMDIPVQ